MAENKQANAPGAADALPSMAEYKKSQQRVRELIERRRNLERHLVGVEDAILQKEISYLESTPSGNIITGFDNYMKGQSGAAAQRRKTGTMDQNRVFSKSSISYRPSNNGNGNGSASGSGANGDSTTPGSAMSSHAPTPVSASFKDSGSGTPNQVGKTTKLKKGKAEAAAAAAAAVAEDSENDSSAAANTKKRTNFGTSRK